MKKVWILERYISTEEMQSSLNELLAIREANEGNAEAQATVDDMIEAYQKRMAANPDGYWLGYQGKTIYQQFVSCARETMRNLKGSQFRVLKAEIEDSAMMWPGYVNGVENEGVLKYLLATM